MLGKLMLALDRTTSKSLRPLALLKLVLALSLMLKLVQPLVVRLVLLLLGQIMMLKLDLLRSPVEPLELVLFLLGQRPRRVALLLLVCPLMPWSRGLSHCIDWRGCTTR
mmetsp:Transcript_34790/g.80747  ORF Transcript_34790/g.80747 Transcript_34790/m.80747 type:complete len:109 (+) Transcript_34790:1419-1745(+)